MDRDISEAEKIVPIIEIRLYAIFKKGVHRRLLPKSALV